jgi:hypothetical protein
MPPFGPVDPTKPVMVDVFLRIICVPGFHPVPVLKAGLDVLVADLAAVLKTIKVSGVAVAPAMSVARLTFVLGEPKVTTCVLRSSGTMNGMSYTLLMYVPYRKVPSQTKENISC